jgi:hypothetical protein
MQRLVVNEEHREARELQQQQPHQHQQHEISYSDFLAIHLPVFIEATDPLEADSLLCTSEAKFSLLRCSEMQTTMMLFTAQQLYGPASAWWVTFTATLPDSYQVSWALFCEAFCEHHIPDGLMDRKQQEFLDLKQGPGTVYEYCKRFIYLAQYGAYHIDMDTKKTTLFRRGLCAKIHE